MSDSTNAVVAKPLKVVGGIYVFAKGVALPTDATSTISAAGKPLGYITDDGVTRSIDRDTSQIFAWGGQLLATTRKSAAGTVQFTAAEYLNPDAQGLYYGAANVSFTPATSSSGSVLTISGDLSAIPPHVGIVIDVLTDSATGRIVYPDWQASSIDDVVLKDDELTALNLTGDIFPDATGKSFYEYWVKNDKLS